MVTTVTRLDSTRENGNQDKKNVFLYLTGLSDPVIFLYKLSDLLIQNIENDCVEEEDNLHR